MSTYIIIEVPGKESALEVMNVLMTHSDARFFVTQNLQEYVDERKRLATATSQQKTSIRPSSPEFAEPLPPPPFLKDTNTAEVSSNEPEPAVLIPKTEPVHDIDDYGMMNNWNAKNPMFSMERTLHESSVFTTIFDETPPIFSQKGRPRSSTSQRKQTELRACKMCGVMIRVPGLEFYERSNHAITHTPFQKYICPIDQCGFKVRHRPKMSLHMKSAHPGAPKLSIVNCLRPEEEEELRRMVVKCFPEMEGVHFKNKGKRPVRSVQKNEEPLNMTEQQQDVMEPSLAALLNLFP